MRIKSRNMLLVLVSALVLSACQTPMQSDSIVKPMETVVTKTPIPIVEVIVDSDGDGTSDELDMCPGTPPNLVVDARGCPFDLLLIGALKMEYRAFFAKGSSELSKEYQLELDKIAAKLQEYEKATMSIEGHASEDEISATDLRSDSLARNRALIVKNYLIMQHQIDPDRLSISSYDAKQPIASSDTEEGKSMNRRIYGIAMEPED